MGRQEVEAEAGGGAKDGPLGKGALTLGTGCSFLFRERSLGFSHAVSFVYPVKQRKRGRVIDGLPVRSRLRTSNRRGCAR